VNLEWTARRAATIGVAVLLALTAGYSATRAFVSARPAPMRASEADTPRESRNFRFEVEDATLRKVDLIDSRIELTSDLLGIFGARLQVTDRTEILLDGQQARLADLPEGARVKASYDLRDGVKVARAISAEKPEPEEPPAVKR
jgi:hypothetical protein